MVPPRGEEQGYFIAAFGTAVMMLIMILCSPRLFSGPRRCPDCSERRQRLAEETLIMANQELEQRVAEAHR